MKKFLLFLLSLLIFLTLIALTTNPNEYTIVCFNGLKVWAVTVLPALLPFMFLTILLFNLLEFKSLTRFLNPVCKFLYAENGLCGYVQIMSFISGYPIGAKLLAELAENNLICKTNAEKISVCASTSGPAFIIAGVGSAMLKDKLAGIILFICHLLSAILNGIIFKKHAVYQHTPPLLHSKQKSKNLFYNCAFTTFTSCLIVGVFIAFFFVISQMLYDFKLTLPLDSLFTLLFKDEKKATAFTAGLIECTKGCILLSQTQGLLKLPLICALLSFGGISVIVQSIAFLKQANLSIKFFILGKVVQTLTAFTLCIIVCLLTGYQ